MKILHVILCRGPFPAFKYGGTERVVWSLATEQIKAGHEVKFLMRPHKERPQNTIFYNKKKPMSEQVTDWPDIVHFHCHYNGELGKPYVCTEHANAGGEKSFSQNTIFISKKHAQNHKGNCYVFNGLDWDEYGKPNFQAKKQYCHFLGKATSRHKNMSGSAKLARAAGYKMAVLGGSRFEVGKSGYFNFDFNLSFKGMVGGEEKFDLIKNSDALLFPVLWHEPFGLAVTESLFLGTPVIASDFGSLPELITEPEIGITANNYSDMQQALENIDQFDRKRCHEFARDKFNSNVMYHQYMTCYEKVLNGAVLNEQVPHTNASLQETLTLLP